MTALNVYSVVTRERDGKKLWIRVGSATRQPDGSISVALDALPTNGSLVIREQPTSEVSP